MKMVHNWENRTQTNSNINKRSCGSTIISAFGAFCQQSIEISSRSASGRFLIIFLFFCSIMILNFYTSVLVSTLVGSSLKTNIKDIRDLADSNYHIGFDNVTYMRGFLNVKLLISSN